MIDLVKRNKNTVVSNFRVFSSQPVTTTDKKKIVISYEDLVELKEEMLESAKLETDEDKRIVIESDIENRFMTWYKNKDMKKDYRDFLLDPSAKVTKSVQVKTSSV